jgi:hypothetical protein
MLSFPPSSFVLCQKSSIRREDATPNQADRDCRNAVRDLGFDSRRKALPPCLYR